MLKLADVINVVVRNGGGALHDDRFTLKLSRDADGAINGVEFEETPPPEPDGAQGGETIKPADGAALDPNAGQPKTENAANGEQQKEHRYSA